MINTTSADAFVEPTEYSPMSVLVNTLKSDDIKRRVKAIENLHQFCQVLGPMRTRGEMIPFIKGMPLFNRVHGR